MKRVNTSTPKKQHYVPQFILKNFKSGKKKRVYVFDKYRKLSYTSSIRDAACENGYYNIKIDGTGYTIENKLATLESISSEIISKIVQQETLSNISSDEFMFFSLFCAVQILRTPTQRDFGQQFQDTVVHWVNRQGEHIDQIENFEVLDALRLKRSHVQNINSLALELSEHFRDKALILVKAPVGHQFFVSDNPITMYNHKPRYGRGNLGLALDGIEIQMPISKKLSLTFACPKMINETINKLNKYKQLRSFAIVAPIEIREVEELVYAIESGNVKELKPENVKFHNSLQVIQSSRFIYSSKDDFSLVKDMLTTNPECMYSPRIGNNLDI